MNKKGLLFVISGPSGSGKGTIDQILAQDSGVYFSISATTRPPRQGEVHGEHYYYVSHEEFEQRLRQGEILEYNQYCGHYYGTPKKVVFEHLDKGHDVILEIDVNGALKVMEKIETVSIFIMPPSWEVLEQRLRGRGTETEDVIQNRLAEAKSEIKKASAYDYIVINDSLEQAVGQIKAIMSAEKNRTKHMTEFIRGVVDNDEQAFS